MQVFRPSAREKALLVWCIDLVMMQLTKKESTEEMPGLDEMEALKKEVESMQAFMKIHLDENTTLEDIAKAVNDGK